MDFAVWAIAMTISFALSILAVKDRVIGIAGIMTGFVTNAIAGNDNSIVMARGFDSSGNAFQQTIAFQPEFLVLAFTILSSEIVILFTLNDIYGKRDHDEEGLINFSE